MIVGSMEDIEDTLVAIAEAKHFFCYMLQSADKKRTYIGATVNPDRRLRQHNGELVGGARATHRVAGEWKRVALVSGFPTWQAALQFEWAWKFRSRRHGPGLGNRIKGLLDVLNSPSATSKAVPFAEWPAPPIVDGTDALTGIPEWPEIQTRFSRSEPNI
jgi:predicted GIY-YIG superfamily endonuclease